MDIYQSDKTLHTFNLLLNGRWHSGFTPDTYGQIKLEEQLISIGNISKKSKVLDFGSGNGLVTCDYHILTGANVIGITNNIEQVKLSNKLANKLNISDKVKFMKFNVGHITTYFF